MTAKIFISNQFQRSIRLDLDLDNIEALKGYITVQSSLNTLNTMARAVLERGDYAFTWTGAYGSGKSALALMLAALCSKDETAKNLACKALRVDAEEGRSLKQLFVTDNSYNRLCLVGGRKSLRHDLYRMLCALSRQKCQLSDSEELPTDVIYERLDKYLKSRRLLLIIDELGKYLEYAIKTNDVYFLQELADYASRSDGKLIVVGILHQSFDAYVGYMPEEIRKEWAKVQGRFENYVLEPSPYESLNLIANSIEKVDYDGSAHAELVKSLGAYLSQYSLHFKDQIETLLDNSLPLHGITAILLASWARKSYGQNERSIYSFLNSMEPYSLNDFLEHAQDLGKALYRPCNLYDYLRVNQDININLSKDSHKWAIAKELIETVEYSGAPARCAELLKTIAVIDIFSAVFRLSAAEELLRLCMDCTAQEFDDSLDYLLKHNTLIYRKNDEAYHLFIGSDFDFERELNRELNKTDFDLDLLNELTFDKAKVIARRHYQEKGSLRWMKISLVNADHLRGCIENFTYNGDCFGQFILCICTDEAQFEEVESVAEELSDEGQDEIKGLVLGYVPNSQELINKTREYTAISALRFNEALEGDELARKEVAMRLQDSKSQLEGLLEELMHSAVWLYKDHAGTLNQKQMSSIASELADTIYRQTFTINNELINRSAISPNVTAARRVLLNKLITKGSEEKLGMTGTPAEFGIYDSLIASMGLHQRLPDGSYAVNYKNAAPDEHNQALLNFLRDTEKFVVARQSLTLDELYAFWMGKPYGIKAGVLPIYALIFILSNVDTFAFYDKDFFITALEERTVDEILVHSDVFTIKSFKEKSGYQNIIDNTAEAILEVIKRNVGKEPLSLARALVRFCLTLPKFTAVSANLSTKAKILRSTLSKADDPIKLICEDLPKICDDLNQSPAALKALLSELKEHFDKTLSLVKERFFEAIDERQSLQNLALRAKSAAEHTSDIRIKRLHDLLTQYQNDEKTFIRRLIVMCSEVTEDRWNDAAIEKTIYDLPKISLAFRQAECFANVTDSRQARRMISLTFAASAKQDKTLIAEISPDDEKIVKHKVDDLSAQLQGMSFDLKVAILAELGQSLNQSAESKAD